MSRRVRHTIRVTVGNSYARATCSCGWWGPKRPVPDTPRGRVPDRATYNQLQDDGDLHKDTAERFYQMGER